MTKTTDKIVTDVIETAERVAKRSTQKFPVAAAPGDAVRQGDVYLTFLESLPSGVRKMKTPTQLAPGTSQGSRHVLDSTDGVSAYELANATEFDGPVLCLACERTVTHPEHGDWVLSEGIYAVSYQRTQDVLDQQRRVQD